MPTRLTFADAVASRLPNILNLTSTDVRVYQFVNEATQRLMNKGKWVGTMQKYRICTSNGALTWPRQIETIEAAAICDWPIPIRNGWFEFVENGFGLREESTGYIGSVIDVIGTACSYNDITPSGKKLKLYCANAEDATAAMKVLLQGYDDDGNWIRTKVGAVWYDGEWVQPSVAGTLSTNYFASLTGVQKPVSVSAVTLFEYDTVGVTQRQIAYYEHDETRPVYRRTLIPGLSQCGTCCDSETITVTVLAKMAFLPVTVPTDWLLIGNLPALKLMCQAIRKEENNLWDEARRYELSAIEELQKELNTFNGDSVVAPLRLPSSSIYGGNVNRLDACGYPSDY